MPYFNYRAHITPTEDATYWQRREFLGAWWSIYAGDPRWTPPDHRQLDRDLQPGHNPHLARLRALTLYVDALHRTGLRTARQDQALPMADILERPLAAALALIDPRRSDNTAYLALLQTANDAEALERLLDALGDSLRRSGIRRLLGPTGLSPYLGSGLQTDGWSLQPPSFAPSNPPYVPELLTELMLTVRSGTLYEAAVPSDAPAPPDPAVLQPLEPSRLANDLRPLWAAILSDALPDFPAPDESETTYLLRAAGDAARSGWLAMQDNRPVGFVLLGPDTGTALRRARGGRRLHRRAWLSAERRLGNTKAGRLLFGGVLPDAQRRGIGRQLWSAAMGSARAAGWSTISVGPVWSAAGQAYLAAQGAAAVQTAELLEWTL
jgi:ribosomal protein S18 acetylase RimI-like enzyme